MSGSGALGKARKQNKGKGRTARDVFPAFMAKGRYMAISTQSAPRGIVSHGDLLSEYTMAEEIRKILVNEQKHQIDLATALGEGVPGRTRALCDSRCPAANLQQN